MVAALALVVDGAIVLVLAPGKKTAVAVEVLALLVGAEEAAGRLRPGLALGTTCPDRDSCAVDVVSRKPRTNVVNTDFMAVERLRWAVTIYAEWLNWS